VLYGNVGLAFVSFNPVNLRLPLACPQFSFTENKGFSCQQMMDKIKVRAKSDGKHQMLDAFTLR
jgi:hypothetical protein